MNSSKGQNIQDEIKKKEISILRELSQIEVQSLETIQDLQAFQGISVVDIVKDNLEYEYFSVTSPNNVCVKSYKPTITFYDDVKNIITKEKNWRVYL
jgi:hypothetical protein